MSFKKNMTDDEKLACIEKREKLIKSQKKELNNTRLIKIGKVCEKIYGKKITEIKLEKLEHFLREQEARGQFFSKALD